MALEADELAQVRDEIGVAEPPSDSDLDDIHDRVGGTVGVVRAVWAQRLAALLALPASFNVSGEYSQNTSANIEAIQKRLAQLSSLPDDSNDIPPQGADPMVQVTSAHLIRCNDGGR